MINMFLTNARSAHRSGKTSMLAALLCISVAYPLESVALAQSYEASIRPQVTDAQRGVETKSHPREAMPTVTVNLKGVSRIEALRRVSKAAGFSVILSESVVQLPGNVDRQFARTPLDEAIRNLLAGTGVKSEVVLKTRSVLITRPSQQRQDSVGRDSLVSVIGVVVDSSSKGRVSNVVVSLIGTSYRAVTNEDGSFLLSNVPPGDYIITAQRLGYRQKPQKITVPLPDQEIVLMLPPSATTLTDVVTTGAGDQQRLELGNSVATINADSVVGAAPIRNLSDLLKSRAPGLDVQSVSGGVGSGSRIRIRGIASILSNLDPIVIVDGIRINAEYSHNNASVNAFNSGIPATSRLDDIDPESIETIDVLKGPAASALYGSDAAAGVIVIKTKRGKAGPTRWNLAASRSVISMRGQFPEIWKTWGSPMFGNRGCLAEALANPGMCAFDSASHYNPLNDKMGTPLSGGSSSSYNFNVSGGTQYLQYFVGASILDDIGVLKLPDRDRELALARRNGVPLPSWMKRPNIQKSASINNKLTAQFGTSGDVTFSLSGTRRNHRDVLQGSGGLIGMTMLTGAGYRDSINQGWGNTSLIDQFSTRNSDNINRVSGSISTNWRPLLSLSARATAGLDFTFRQDENLQRREEIPGNDMPGRRSLRENRNRVNSVDLGVSHDLALAGSRSLRSAVGLQYNSTSDSYLMVTARGLPIGGTTIRGATTITSDENARESATAGWYFNETAKLRPQLYVTGALRGDVGSAFGSNAKVALYPKWNASWLLSQESFFPRLPYIDNVRLRMAYGNAGVQPDLQARFRTYSVQSGFVVDDTYNYLQLNSLGNSELLPEKSVEIEGGVDFAAFNERLNIDITYYTKSTRNALVSRTLPQSVGFRSRQENLGDLRNSGLEISGSVRPIDYDVASWNLNIGYARNTNKLIKLGNTDLTPSAPYLYRVGYPIDALWERPIVGFADANENGYIEVSEIRLADSLKFLGTAAPQNTISLHNNLALLSGRLSISAGFDLRGPMMQINGVAQQLCLALKCEGVVNPSANTASQVMAALGSIPVVGLPALSNFPFLERVSTLRFNEFSVRAVLPKGALRAMKVNSGSISLMGRNLGLWSKYKGADPEVNTSNAGYQSNDSGAIPPTRDWSIRFNLGF